VNENLKPCFIKAHYQQDFSYSIFSSNTVQKLHLHLTSYA